MSSNCCKTFLALGDSYTIGESVLLYESFPYQTIQLLRKAGYYFNAPEIIAKTGWTTDELIREVETVFFQPPYDFVSLLIGVNNQYRGRTINEYAFQLDVLVEKAIELAGKNNNRVIMLSIPDWSVTPFAANRNCNEIALEIERFNEVGYSLAINKKIQYINITKYTQEAAIDESLLSIDALHPSANAYFQWANELCRVILRILLRESTQ